MSIIGRRGIHYLQKLNSPNVPTDLIHKGQNRVIDASLTLIREKAKLKGELVRALGGAVASSSLLGVPLGHNSSFLQGPAFAPPRIREAIWCGSTNSTTEEGKELKDPRVLTDVGDVPVQEIRDCGVDDDRLMNVIGESVKLVMEELFRTCFEAGLAQFKVLNTYKLCHPGPCFGVCFYYAVIPAVYMIAFSSGPHKLWATGSLDAYLSLLN
ncbi:putative arginase [Rosa chinensis]|uniref:Putative arginase n=1 Tax=Rosa chinensis TaxID=74649 RepID=A0A2P6SFW7_ROSCH|nr:putative arginase [Rosa chinensis]